uniref:Uncharacterized protein n=1 Tax=Candidatus Kentrum sp. LFY TaxID=2126342 RepID=A0A450UER8_9GAMM|nr:MAG: hypothetical protein BECKLFY1418B_GA0070995_102328 [Candidatus Kentron sp. LFY]
MGLPNSLLQNLEGAENCNTAHCRKLSSFVSQASSGFDATSYLVPKVSLDINGDAIKISKKDFEEQVEFTNDPAWSSLKRVSYFSGKWVAKYGKSRLKLKIGGKTYGDNEVEIVILKVADAYFIQAIKIT